MVQVTTFVLDHLARPETCVNVLQVSTANLERVRKVKTRHQRLKARATTVRAPVNRKWSVYTQHFGHLEPLWTSLLYRDICTQIHVCTGAGGAGALPGGR